MLPDSQACVQLSVPIPDTAKTETNVRIPQSAGRNERRPKLETCPRIPKWIFLLDTLAFTPLALLLSTGRIRGAAGASFETRGQKEPARVRTIGGKKGRFG